MLLTLAACQPALVSEDPSGELPSAWSYEGEQEAEPELPELEVVVAAVDAAIARARSFNGDPIVAAYEASLAGADADCPGWYDYMGSTYWYGACTSELGTSFDGYGLHYVYEDEDLYGDGSRWDLDYLYGVADVASEDASFHLGGYVWYGVGRYGEEQTAWQSTVLGSFAWDGEASGSWLDEGIAPGLSTWFSDYPGYQLSYVVVEGSLGELGGEVSAVDFDELTLVRHEVAVGSYWPCSGEPMGGIRARTEAGWVELAFEDVVVDGEGYQLAGTCDGCGQAWLGGDYLGEACVDAAQLLDWEEAPW